MVISVALGPRDIQSAASVKAYRVALSVSVVGTVVIEITGDLLYLDVDAVCITTNGFRRENGHAVWGAGLAKQARDRWPDIEAVAGVALGQYGNHVRMLTYYDGSGISLVGTRTKSLPYHLVTFPTKPANIVVAADQSNILPYYRTQYEAGHLAPGWVALSTIDLVERSTRERLLLVVHTPGTRIALPMVGCGRGGLSYPDLVRPYLQGVLDDRFRVCTTRTREPRV